MCSEEGEGLRTRKQWVDAPLSPIAISQVPRCFTFQEEAGQRFAWADVTPAPVPAWGRGSDLMINDDDQQPRPYQKSLKRLGLSSLEKRGLRGRCDRGEVHEVRNGVGRLFTSVTLQEPRGTQGLCQAPGSH